MEKQQLSDLRHFSGFVGDFIRYWGFRRIHGQIWSILYLSARPLSGVEIISLLGVSKALVSPALKELENEGLIKQTESENAKTKRYQAVEDVQKIIAEVLQRREKPMLNQISQSFSQLQIEDQATYAMSRERATKLGLMISTAQMSLAMLLESENLFE